MNGPFLARSVGGYTKYKGTYIDLKTEMNAVNW